MQNVSFNLDKEVSIYVFGTPFYVVVYSSYKLLHMVHFLMKLVKITAYKVHVTLMTFRRSCVPGHG